MNKASVPALVAVVAFAVTFAILLLFLLHFDRTNFNSDDAVVNMLADAMWSQGRLFPHGWITNNGDLMVPSGALLVAPLLRWFPNGFALHSVVGVFAAVLFPLALRFLLKPLRVPSFLVIFALTFVVSGISILFTQMVFAQTTYFWWPAGFFVGAAMIVRARSALDAKAPTWTTVALMFLLVGIIAFANPWRVALMVALPLYALDWTLRSARLPSGAEHARGWRRLATTTGADDRLTAVGIVGAFFVAALIYEALKQAGITETVYGAARLRWAGWPSVWKHARVLASSWFFYLGASDAPWYAQSVVDFASRTIRLSMALALSGLGIVEMVQVRRQKEPTHRAMAIAFIVAFLPILFLTLIYEPLAIDINSARYFTVPICILIVLAVLRLRDADFMRSSFARGGIALFALVIAGLAAQRVLPMGTFGTDRFFELKESPKMQLVDLLKRENLRWGYATWWNAGSVGVLSDGFARVTPVAPTTNGIAQFGYMSLRAWYEPRQWEGESFLALSRTEASASRLDTLNVALGEPVRIVDAPDFRVLVYDRNIADSIECAREVSFDIRLQKEAALPRLLAAKFVVRRGKQTARMLRVRIRNDSTATIAGSGRYPMSVGVQLIDTRGRVSKLDWTHAPLSCPLVPGEEREMNVVIPQAPDGQWSIRVDLVQEGVAWLGNWGGTVVTLPLARPQSESADEQADARER